MCEGNVADVNPQEDARRGQAVVLELALDHVPDALVRGVERVERVEVVHDRTEDQGRIDGGDLEVGLFRLDEVPRCLFGFGLASSVGDRRVLARFGPWHWVPA